MKRFLVSILTFIFIVLLVTNVNAATGSISVGASSDTVLKGKTFTVTVAGTADNNITGMQAQFTYDSNKLSIEGKNAGTGFSDVSGSNEIALTSTSSENLSKSATLYTITFKVLDTAEVGDTTISVTNAVLALVNENAEQENTAESNADVTITIKEDDTTVDNQGGVLEDDNTQQEEPENTNTTPSNTTDKSNTSSKPSTSNKKNTTTNKTTKLPQTGLESTSFIVLLALIVVSIASYVSYRKYKNI